QASCTKGGVSNVDIDGNNTLQIKAIGVVISTFETLPPLDNPRNLPDVARLGMWCVGVSGPWPPWAGHPDQSLRCGKSRNGIRERTLQRLLGRLFSMHVLGIMFETFLSY